MVLFDNFYGVKKVTDEKKGTQKHDASKPVSKHFNLPGHFSKNEKSVYEVSLHQGNNSISWLLMESIIVFHLTNTFVQFLSPGFL